MMPGRRTASCRFLSVRARGRPPRSAHNRRHEEEPGDHGVEAARARSPTGFPTPTQRGRRAAGLPLFRASTAPPPGRAPSPRGTATSSLCWRTHRPPPAGTGSVVNRCGGGWSAGGRRAVRPRESHGPKPRRIRRCPHISPTVVSLAKTRRAPTSGSPSSARRLAARLGAAARPRPAGRPPESCK